MKKREAMLALALVSLTVSACLKVMREASRRLSGKE